MLPYVKEVQPSPCLCNVFFSWFVLSPAVSRIGESFILFAESSSHWQPTGDEIPANQPSTPKPYSNVKVFCELSFRHSINSTLASNSEAVVVVSGRIDHGVGIVFQPINKPKRCFHSLLLCVEAKVKDNLGSAYGELVVYLASLRESYINKGKSYSSVYGIATDGINYVSWPSQMKGPAGQQAVWHHETRIARCLGLIAVYSGEDNFYVAELIPKERASAWWDNRWYKWEWRQGWYPDGNPVAGGEHDEERAKWDSRKMCIVMSYKTERRERWKKRKRRLVLQYTVSLC